MIDDFAHNPDKIDATLATLRAQPGRLLIMFQPHGYGPLTKMGEELADELRERDGARRPALLAGPGLPGRHGRTHARIRLAGRAVSERGAQADHIPERAAIGEALLAEARDGDRILIMGARDDSLQRIRGRPGRKAGVEELIGASGVGPAWQSPAP